MAITRSTTRKNLGLPAIKVSYCYPECELILGTEFIGRKRLIKRKAGRKSQSKRSNPKTTKTTRRSKPKKHSKSSKSKRSSVVRKFGNVLESNDLLTRDVFPLDIHISDEPDVEPWTSSTQASVIQQIHPSSSIENTSDPNVKMEEINSADEVLIESIQTGNHHESEFNHSYNRIDEAYNEVILEKARVLKLLLLQNIRTPQRTHSVYNVFLGHLVQSLFNYYSECIPLKSEN